MELTIPLKIEIDEKQLEEAIDKYMQKNPDIVEVVRCKECKYGTLCYGEIKCTLDEDDCGIVLYHKPQHYCGYGERREG